ncbi:head-tail adaptor protein [Phaeobacter marinintestinus]|uniref:head-tail adaptor protein n=1 Tax=Falsiphaeobacter marinintestinus TaxID=1492905 RepID=UPI0011B5748C|nr:head-tail adaptor protein [Phaeobacter marinintestinus]
MKQPNLNRKLVLEAPARVSDGAGGFSEIWTALGELWAEMRARTGRERAEAGMPVSAVAYRIVVRAAPVGSAMRPTPEQRLRDGARVFVIRAVADVDAQGRFLTCFADEETAA